MINKLKYFLIGSPLPSAMMSEKRLNKLRALAAFSPDALSSVAYANQEIFLGLMIAGGAGLSFQFPIALAIILLLGIVALSYAQTIRGYPSGGGSYIVARENLGTYPGLVAGGALLLDYILTAAVSLTAGVAAISSAFPELWPYRVWLALGLLGLIMLLNLRGLREFRNGYRGTGLPVPGFIYRHVVVRPGTSSHARCPNPFRHCFASCRRAIIYIIDYARLLGRLHGSHRH